MRAEINRRAMTKWMMSASVGSFLSPGELRASASAQISANRQQALRDRIEQAIANGSATGVAVAVVQAGRIVWEEGFGWANREAGLKVTPHTPFGMASITKPFSTTTVMTLVQQGDVALDGPANAALGSSKIVGANGNPAAATVRMLGAHVSGLPGMYESYDDAETRLVPSPDTLLRNYGRLAYPPGAVYEYSNIGYAALNAITSAKTRQEFGALMHERVLAPLGLNDSFFASDKARLSSGATRYDPTGHPIPHYVTSTAASGELYASAHDLARFLLFNMGHRLANHAPVLSKQSLSELHRPVFRGPSGLASTFGWFQGSTPSGVPFFVKTGGDPGVANRMCYLPSMGLGCVALTNQSNAAPLAYGICDEVIRAQVPDWQQPEEDCGSPRTPLVDAAPFAGEWRGVLENDGIRRPVTLHVTSAQTAIISLGDAGPHAITEIQAEGKAFTGNTICSLDSADTLRAGAHTLHIKLIPHADQLIGRVFAVAGDPSFKNATLPYVLSLKRS